MKKQSFVLTFILYTFLLIFNTVSAGIDFAEPPKSLEKLVKTSDAIIVGKLKEIVDNSLFYGYQESASELEKLDKQTPIQIGIYKTDFRLKVNKFLKGNGDKKDIIVRISSNEIADVGKSNSSMKKNKDKIKKQIFFLSKNPDSTYSLHTVMGALFFKKSVDEKGLEKEKIIFKSKGKDTPAFGKKIDANAFLNEISSFVK